MEIKTAMGEHFKPIRMARIKNKTKQKQKKISVGKDVEKLEPSHC